MSTDRIELPAKTNDYTGMPTIDAAFEFLLSQRQHTAKTSYICRHILIRGARIDSGFRPREVLRVLLSEDPRFYQHHEEDTWFLGGRGIREHRLKYPREDDYHG